MNRVIDRPRASSKHQDSSRASRVESVKCLLLCLAAAAAGCSMWRGELDPGFEKRLDERIRRIEQARLESVSRDAPVSLEQGLAAMKDRGRFPVPTTAPASVDVSIEDARRFVLENNLDLRVYSLDPEIARTKISEEEAKFDATISVGLTYRKKDLPELEGDFVQFTEKSSRLDKLVKGLELAEAEFAKLREDQVDKKQETKIEKAKVEGIDDTVFKTTILEQRKEQIDAEAGINVPLPTGGKIKLGQYVDRVNTLSPYPADQSTAAPKFSLSQPLLRGAGIDVNLASIRIARLGAKATTARTKLVAIRLLAAAEKSYWKLFGARSLLEVRRQLNDLAEKNLDLVKKRSLEGLVAPVEITRAEAGAALQFESLIIAETSERLQERDLKRILNIQGVSMNSPTQLVTKTQPLLVQYRLDGESLASQALANRMEMLELELALAADAIRIEFAKNQALPIVALEFEYGLFNSGNSVGSAWEQNWGFDKPQFGIGIRGEIPVTNEARKAQVRREVLTRTQRLATREAREQTIRQEVYDALDVMNQNWQSILAARQSAIASGINYQAELRQFDQGNRTMREVFDALTQLGDAQTREIKAIVAYQVALVDLAFATGTLMGYAKVDFIEPGFR